MLAVVATLAAFCGGPARSALYPECFGSADINVCYSPWRVTRAEAGYSGVVMRKGPYADADPICYVETSQPVVIPVGGTLARCSKRDGGTAAGCPDPGPRPAVNGYIWVYYTGYAKQGWVPCDIGGVVYATAYPEYPGTLCGPASFDFDCRYPRSSCAVAHPCGGNPPPTPTCGTQEFRPVVPVSLDPGRPWTVGDLSQEKYYLRYGADSTTFAWLVPGDVVKTNCTGSLSGHLWTCVEVVCAKYAANGCRGWIRSDALGSPISASAAVPCYPYLPCPDASGSPSLSSSYEALSFQADMLAGSVADAWVEYRNTGTQMWVNAGSTPTTLGTWGPQDRSSVFYTPGDWLSPTRPTAMDQTWAQPNGTGRFSFRLTAPSTAGQYEEHWRLAKQGVGYFGDDTVSINIKVISVIPSRAANVWFTAPTFVFGAYGGFGVATLDHYAYAWDREATHAFTGTEATWSSSNLVRTATEDGRWYLHLKGFSSSGASIGTVDLGPFCYDGTPPTAVTVTDQGTWTPSLTTLSARWTGAMDGSGSGVADYQYAVGKTPTTQETKGWTSVGANTSMSDLSLSLSEGERYYVQVRARDAAGLVGAASAADGIGVAPDCGSIGLALRRPDSVGLSLRNKILTASSSGVFWLEEPNRSAGLMVISDAIQAKNHVVNVAGVMGAYGTQRALYGDVVEDLGLSEVVPKPLGMANRWIGGGALKPYTPGVTGGASLYNIGLLVKTWGSVTLRDVSDPANKFFYVNDGSIGGLGPCLGIKVMCGGIEPPLAGTVTVTGVVSSEQTALRVAPVLIITEASDIVAPAQ